MKKDSDKVVIIATGSELLIGQGLNTNAQYLSQHLAARGFTVIRHETVGDSHEEMTDSIRRGLEDAEIVITTGGLGPTLDDVTREACEEASGISLEQDEEVIRQIKERFNRINRQYTENNASQGRVPVKGGWFPNPNGTAPGLWFDLDDKLLIALPGPPREMNPMLEQNLFPLLDDHMPQPKERISREIHLAGMGESDIDQVCRPIVEPQKDLTYSILARPGLVDITLYRWVPRGTRSDELLDETNDKLVDRLGAAVYSTDERSLERVVGDRLRELKKTMVTAESCTGGLVAESMTSISGSSDYFLGSYVTYSNEMKMRTLGVSKLLIEEHGAVSPQVARAMAQGARERSGADYAVSLTGIAGPSGGTEEKPVGLVHITAASHERTWEEEHRFFGGRKSIRERSRVAALNLLRLMMQERD